MSSEPPVQATASPRASNLGLKLGLSLLVAAAFVWLLRAGALPVWPSEKELARISMPHFAVAALLWSTMHVARTWRWQLLVKSVADTPPVRVAGIALVGFAAAVLLPLRTGEAVRPVLLGRQGASAWAGAGTVAGERVIDGAFISTLLLICINIAHPHEPLPVRLGDLPVNVALVPRGASVAAAFFVSAFVVLLLFYRFRALAHRLTHLVLDPLSPRLAKGVTSRVEQLAEGLGFFSKARVTVPFMAITIVYWACNAMGLWILARGLGFSALSPTGAVAALGVMAVGITLPSAPGLFGSYQLGLYAGLLLYLPTAEVTTAGSALVFAMYVTQVGIHVIGGLVGWALLGAKPAPVVSS